MGELVKEAGAGRSLRMIMSERRMGRATREIRR